MGFTPPKKHEHIPMRWTERACWCETCGQTWKMTERGWFPLPSWEVEYGERVYARR